MADEKDYVEKMLDQAEKGKLGGTLRESRPEGQPVVRPSLPALLLGAPKPPPPPKSHLPQGVSQSPEGDIGAHRGAELRAAFPRQIKNSGGYDKNPLSVKKFDCANDYGDGASTR